MKQNINIEAEGAELILKNKAGDYVIIPKKYRTEVQGMIKDGCHSCIDKVVETLPVMNDYAEDGTLIPKDKKKITLEHRPYTAIQSSTYVAPKVIPPLEKKQFNPREQPVLKADTRTEQQRKIAQEYTESVLNPSISRQIGEAFQKPLRWSADPIKGVGDIVSAIAPKSALAKDLPNTYEDTFEYRKKQLSPYTSGKEKLKNTVNEVIPLTNWAMLNTLPVEAVAGNTIKAGKKLIKPASKVLSKKEGLNKIDNILQESNQLPEPPHEIILNQPSNYLETINLERQGVKNKKIMLSFDDVDIGSDLILRNNPSRIVDQNTILGKNRAIKSVLNKKTNESIDLKTWEDIDGKLYYYMSANMPSSKVKAGRAYMELEKHIPKGESILENTSLSYDSFLNILKQTKNPKFETFIKGKIPMNDNAKNNLLKIKGDSYLGSNYFNSEELANSANKELIELTNKYSLPNPSVVPVTTSSGKIKAYEIQLPNIGLKKLYTILGLTSAGAAIQSQNQNKTEQ